MTFRAGSRREEPWLLRSRLQCWGGDLQSSPQERIAPAGPPIRDRSLRGEPTRCLLRPVLWLGTHEPRCTAVISHRCSLCEGDHQTTSHRCPVEGLQARKGQPRAHVVSKCTKCRGPHFIQASVCLVRWEARQFQVVREQRG